MTPTAQTAALLAWYDEVARDLPWRGEVDPYRVWVSEIMLQQTQVETVKPFYARWCERFPTVQALAEADLEDVLNCWQGLGYYRRARSLHAAAQQIVAAHGGRLPDELATLRKLPGIGDYTAGAIASIAFGTRAPAIDGNVVRVVTRLAAIGGEPGSGATKSAVRESVEALLPAERPGDFNQALMELGATVCTPTKPGCESCPLRGNCRALAAGDVERYPETSKAAQPRDRLHVCAVIAGPDGWLVGRRPLDGRWGGLWELPRVELDPGADPAAGLRNGLAESLGVDVEVLASQAMVRHAVSGERIRLEAWTVRLDGDPEPVGYDALQWTWAFGELPMSTAQRKLLRALTLDQG